MKLTRRLAMGIFLGVLFLIGLVYSIDWYPKYEYLNFDKSEFSELGAQGIDQFHTENTNEIMYPDWAATLLAPWVALHFDNPRWPGELDNGYSIAEALDETGYVNFNCAMCHSGVVGNTFVGGLPNKHFNPKLLTGLLPMAGILSRFTGDLKYNASARYISGALIPLFDKSSHTLNGNVGTWGVFNTAAHLIAGAEDMDAWEMYSSALEKMIELTDGKFPIQHPRPWWLARYNGAHFWLEFTPFGADKSAADLALALATPNYGNPDGRKWDERVEISRAQQQYMSEIQSPEWPETEQPIDQVKAERGYELYVSENCGTCHGHLERRPDGKFNYLPGEEARTVWKYVQTDRAYFDMHVTMDWIFKERLWNNQEFIDAGGIIDSPTVESKDDLYMNAPPLVGVWASAPYFHNGSVPTLLDVLSHEDDRPVRWEVTKNRRDYDYSKVGALYTVPEEADLDNEYIYDTTRDPAFGMTNVGHNLSVDLPLREKMALIEFMKTLSTQTVVPPDWDGVEFQLKNRDKLDTSK